MELSELSDNEERAIPDIIISRSSIPEAERARNIIRMIPMLEEHEEESETKVSGASDDSGDNMEEFRRQTQPPTDSIIQITEAKRDQDDSIQALTQQDTLSHSSTKADAASNIFPAPDVDEFLSEYEDATEDEQVLVADQAHQFKADTAPYEHLGSTTSNEQVNTDHNFCKNYYK